MPLFKLLELLESRFHTNVSLSEVNKLKDICKITDGVTGRIISLAADVRSSPTGGFNRVSISVFVFCAALFCIHIADFVFVLFRPLSK